MDPTTAYSIYANLSGEHQTQLAQKREQLGSVMDMIMGGAQQGLPYNQVAALTQAMAPQMAQRPRVTGALEALYPQSQRPSGPMDPGKMYAMQQAQTQPSVVAQPPDPQQQMLEMEAAQAQQSILLQPRWAEFTQNIVEAMRSKPEDASNIIMRAQSHYADLLQADPEKFTTIINSAYGATPGQLTPTAGA
jgi:hypothetical protein